MEPSSFRPDPHVAQQSLRYKLRIQQTSPHNLQQPPENSDQLLVHSGPVHVPNVANDTMLCDPIVFSSGMVDFSSSCCNSVSTQRDAMANYSILSSANLAGDSQGCGGNWRNIDSHQSCDWMVNYLSESSVGGGGNQKPVFVGEVLSNNARVSCLSTSTTPHHLKLNYDGYNDVQFQANLANTFSDHQDGHQKQLREIKSTFNPIYHSNFQDPVFAIVPSSNSQSSAYFFGNTNDLVSGDGLGSFASKSGQELKPIASDVITHGLSLSLSSNPPSKINAMEFGDQLYESEYLQSKGVVAKEPEQGSKYAKLSYSSAMTKPSIISRSSGKSLQDMVEPSNYGIRKAGPLGPFTGYATILKSSRFLKPAQELLDEFCRGNGSILARTSETSETISRDFCASTSAGGFNATIVEAEATRNDSSVVSPPTFHSSNDGDGDVGVGRSSLESIRPQYQQNKARLLYLQEEVCRRYKQYHQQMQIVASSFELVSGLCSATPYLSSAIKAVSRSFKCLKHAILNQLKQITKALSEDFMSPTCGESSIKVDTSASSLRYIDKSFQKNKVGGGASVGFLEPQEHAWRPQRGLPERAVSILRAWLFEHFLHPYPTDTDKHMLATQTGLSRNQVTCLSLVRGMENSLFAKMQRDLVVIVLEFIEGGHINERFVQVSNWFINARVRVWKPMVEEIHMLESKGLAGSDQTSLKTNNFREGIKKPNNEQPINNSMVTKQLERSGIEQLGTEQWNQEKRSRVELDDPTNMDGSSMSFLPFHRGGIDIGGGLGSVSLTLGLRHGVDNAQHRQQLQQREDDHLMRHQFGGQMIHDFSG